MLFTDFKNKITDLQNSGLGGKASQFKFAPNLRKTFSDEMISGKNPKKAAVLALFYPDEKLHTHFLLTLRAKYNGTHSAQISFPGGKPKENEILQKTAVRETFEEVGVCSSEIKIIRELTNSYIPPSNFMVSPFLGYTEKTPCFKTNYEVETLIEISVNELLSDKNKKQTNITTPYMKNIDVPCFKLNNYIVWGATAMILSEIKDLIQSNFVL